MVFQGGNDDALTVETLAEDGLLDELAQVFDTAEAATEILDALAFPRARRPAFAKFDTPLGYWRQTCTEIAKGRTSGGLERLFLEAGNLYPANMAFTLWHERSRARPRRPEPVAEPAKPAGPPWNVPFGRNPFFKGREKILADLEAALNVDGSAAIAQAISGLGGIGKTQTAVEFAYRKREHYEAVFWVRAETQPELAAGYVEVATLLDLPQKNGRLDDVVLAVRHWLETHGSWLLIFDNADTPENLKGWLPAPGHKGHVLLTSRAQSFKGLARPFRIEDLPSDKALDFLLDRTHRLDASDVERQAASEVAREMGYLPLALEQAAAYVEDTGTSFRDYLAGYRSRKLELLGEDTAPDEHPAVSVTWQMNFDAVAAESPAAADALAAIAFMAPDSIPGELIEGGALNLGERVAEVLYWSRKDDLAFDDLMKSLTRFSLIKRDTEEKTLSIHRLIQEAVRSRMDEETQKKWAERVVAAVASAFPAAREFVNWSRCERFLLQGEQAFALMDRWQIESVRASDLLHNVGLYLRIRGRYTDAAQILRRCLEMRRQDGDVYRIAASFHNLGVVLHDQGLYKEAEDLHRNAINITRLLGDEHPDTATSLLFLAAVLHAQGSYTEAKKIYRDILERRRRLLGDDHPDVLTNLNNLATVLHTQGLYAEAEKIYRDVLERRRRLLGDDHPDVADSLNNLAEALHDQGSYAEAEEIHLGVLDRRRRLLGDDHPYVADTLEHLARLKIGQNDPSTSERLIREALLIDRQALPPEHWRIASRKCILGAALTGLERYNEAESLLLAGYSIVRATTGVHSYYSRRVLGYLVRLYEVWTKPEKTSEYRRLLEEAGDPP